MKNRDFIARFLACVLSAFVFYSCSSDSKDETLLLPEANIEMSSPLENAVVKFGDTLIIRGTATSTHELHGYEIGIRKPGASDLFFQHYHGHSNTINIEEKWKNTLKETADMEVLISVVLDHEQHKQTKTIRFKINNQ
jgi:hypothetical protein